MALAYENATDSLLSGYDLNGNKVEPQAADVTASDGSDDNAEKVSRWVFDQDFPNARNPKGTWPTRTDGAVASGDVDPAAPQVRHRMGGQHPDTDVSADNHIPGRRRLGIFKKFGRGHDASSDPAKNFINSPTGHKADAVNSAPQEFIPLKQDQQNRRPAESGEPDNRDETGNADARVVAPRVIGQRTASQIVDRVQRASADNGARAGRFEGRDTPRFSSARVGETRVIDPRTAAQTADRARGVDYVSDEEKAQWQEEQRRNSRTEDEVEVDAVNSAFQLARSAQAENWPYLASAFPLYQDIRGVAGISEQDVLAYNNFVQALLEQEKDIEDIVDSWHEGRAANPRFKSSTGTPGMSWQGVEARLATIEKVAELIKQIQNNPEKTSRGAEQRVLQDAQSIYEALGDAEARGQVSDELREAMKQNGWDANSPQLTARVATRFNLPVTEAKKLSQKLLSINTQEKSLAIPGNETAPNGENLILEGVYRELLDDPEAADQVDKLKQLVSRYRNSAASRPANLRTQFDDDFDKTLAHLASFGGSSDRQVQLYVRQLLQHWGAATNPERAIDRTINDIDSLINQLRVRVPDNAPQSSHRGAAIGTGASRTNTHPTDAILASIAGNERQQSREGMISLNDAIARLAEVFRGHNMQRAVRSEIPEAFLGEFMAALGDDQKMLDLITRPGTSGNTDALMRGILALMTTSLEKAGIEDPSSAENRTEATESATFDAEIMGKILEYLHVGPDDTAIERVGDVLDKMPGDDLRQDWTALTVCYGYVRKHIADQIGGDVDGRILGGMAERLRPLLAHIPEAHRIRQIGVARLRDLLDKIGPTEAQAVMGDPQKLALALTEYVGSHAEENIPAEEQVKQETENDEKDELYHVQNSLAVTVNALWKALPADQRALKLRSFDDARNFLDSAEGAAAYITSQRDKLTKFNQNRGRNGLNEMGVERQVAADLRELQDTMVHMINEREPGRAGEVMLRAELDERQRNNFMAVDGVTKGGRGAFKINPELLKNAPDLDGTIRTNFINEQGRFDEKKILGERLDELMALPDNATPEDVQRILNKSNTHIQYEAMSQRGLISNRQYARLKNGVVVEMIRDNMGKYVLGIGNGEGDRPSPDVLVADKEMRRTNLEEFDGNMLLGDRLGFGDDCKLTLKTEDGSIFEVRKGKRGWEIEMPPAAKGGPVVRQISEGEVATMVAQVGKRFEAAGEKTDAPVTYIALNYGKLSRPMAKDKAVQRAAAGILRRRNTPTDSLEKELAKQRVSRMSGIRKFLAD